MAGLCSQTADIIKGQLYIFLFAFVLTAAASISEAETVDFGVTCNPIISVEVRTDVTLSCRVKFANGSDADLTDEFVKWSVYVLESNQKIVHMWKRGQELSKDQDPQFQNRTEVDKEGLTKGNIRLTIFNVTMEDSGKYMCFVIISVKHKRTAEIQLNVFAKSVEPTTNPRYTTADVADPTGAIVGGVIGTAIGLIGVVLFALYKTNNLPTFPAGGNVQDEQGNPPQNVGNNAELQPLQGDGHDGNPQHQEGEPAPADDQQNVQNQRPPAQDDIIDEEQQPLQPNANENPQLQEDLN